MHRSGSGAVVRLLRILGCDVPRTVAETETVDERACGYRQASPT